MSNTPVTVLSHASAPLTFKVARSLVVITPTIDSVKDDNNKDVSNNSSTVSATLTLAGKASIRQQVEIRNGNDLLATVTTNASGDWHTTLTGLPVKAYALKAHGMYGSNPASDPWNVTVVQAVKPSITSVKDDQGKPVPPAGSTPSTTLNLTGVASAGQPVQILDGATVLKTETVSTAGEWTSRLTGLAAKAYTFKAKGLYGANPESEAWGLTISDVMCEDFSSLPIGYRFGDWVPHRFGSGLIVHPSNPNTPYSVEAIIVANGSARAISHLDSLNPPLYLDMYVTTFPYPLTRPVTVTVSFKVLSSNFNDIHLRADYYDGTGRNISFSSSVANAAGSVSVTFPVGAHPYKKSENVTGLRVVLTSYLDDYPPVPGTTRIQVNSVCWSQ